MRLTWCHLDCLSRTDNSQSKHGENTISTSKTPRRILVANRGEIAIRIMQAATELGIEAIAVYSTDDVDALHVRKADMACSLTSSGARAYMDGEQLIGIALSNGCDAIHPGYGFLSENANFARACLAADVTFIGPSPETLELFGNKTEARKLAKSLDIPLLDGTNGSTSLAEAREFFEKSGLGGAIMIKAVAGGGGRGMRKVFDLSELEQAYNICRSEAKTAFGSEDVYVERLVEQARHIEVQIIGDGNQIAHLWERECTIQRRHQKVVEIAPAPQLDPVLREHLLKAAMRLADEGSYKSLGTFEFLVDKTITDPAKAFVFIEANPRLQVEHTVTEQVTGLDLVKMQLRIAGGDSLAELGLDKAIDLPRGYAMQLRISAETITENGDVKSSIGELVAFEIPFGPGIRVDTAGFVGYRSNPGFDSLLAKLIAYDASPDYADTVRRAYRALCEFRIDGIETNIPVLQNLLQLPAFLKNEVDTGFFEANLRELTRQEDQHPARYAPSLQRHAVDQSVADEVTEIPAGFVAVRAPMQGLVVALHADVGETITASKEVLILEAMKMEHIVVSQISGRLDQILVEIGSIVREGQMLALIELQDVETTNAASVPEIDLEHIRPDLSEVFERRRLTHDEARPKAVARRRKTKQRTARENIADLVDADSFVEYGAFTVAARQSRNSIEELIERTPADGLIAGVAHVNGDHFSADKARCAVMSYDYTVFAGTQGWKGHEKTDRLLNVVRRRRMPLIFFTEGGGGRPGDTDVINAGGLTTPTFHKFAALSALVPLIGINSGRCFAGNAAVLGCCDVIIATKNSNIGMGGPAMIEGGGLGIYRPEDIGPMSVQVPNGVVDIAVADEAEAVTAAKTYLSYFQGDLSDWDCADQRKLRNVVPENRRRSYDMREAIRLIADTDTVLELRRGFGDGIITSFVRVEGKPLGVVANNPQYLGGAIDSPSADKASRFMQVCDAHDIPVLFLCDTPGNMVGPEAEKTALVRHCSRLFLVGANLTVPFFTVVLRKGYGLGSQAMAGGGFHNPLFLVSWPTGEFGGMGLEGAVRLGYREKLASIKDKQEREEMFQNLVDDLYKKGKALSAASLFEIDDVIDPAETRGWISSAIDTPFESKRIDGKKRPYIDAW